MRTAGLLLAVLLAAAGCAQERTAPAGRLTVAVTFYPIAEFARRLGGDRLEVRQIVPAGVEPHDYDPTPRDLAMVQGSRVFVYNGAGFESWVERILPGIPKTVLAVDTSQGIAPRRGDPHVWLDPVLAQAQVDRIRDGLIQADPAGRAHYDAGAKALRAELAALDRRYAEVLARCRRREFVTSHDAFGYIGARYGLREIPVTGIDPEAEPTPARLREVIAIIRRTGATAVYTEPLLNPRVAETLARETGTRVLVLDPLEGLTDEARARGRDYFTVMYENLDRLAEGLDCGG